MSFEPRLYQQEALTAIEGCYARAVRSCLLVLPTGTGKTNVFCWLIARRHAAGDRRAVLIVAHREELLQQAADRIRQIAPELSVGIERANEKAPPGSAVVIASVQTIGRPGSNRLAWLRESDAVLKFGEHPRVWQYPGLIIIDEAHHAAAAGYGALLERFRGPETDVLGVTATPRRLDRQRLQGTGAVFQEVAYSYPIRAAIRDGWLSDIIGYRVDGGADLSGVKETGGDFAAGELAKQVDDPARTDAALKHWQEVAGQMRTIVFCAGVEHAIHVSDAFNQRGVGAMYVHGGMERKERDSVIHAFRSGAIQVLTNCEILTEGFDAPETACVLMLRPTTSWGLYTQMIGRGTRIAPGKNLLIVIDVVDNCHRHSLATVPAILDLPPGLNLEGKSLAQAAQALDEMGAKASVLQKVQPASWTELMTLLERVDLFADPPVELEFSAIKWLADLGGYRLDCGDGRQARLIEDALGHWELLLTARGATNGSRALLWRQSFSGEMQEAVTAAERVLLEWWPKAELLIAKAARWHRDKPTEKQVEWLRKLGVEECVIEVATKGQAKDMLDRLFSRRRQPASSCR